jgi:tripartite-type tricarboxylate transporter receptor subunit TctC
LCLSGRAGAQGGQPLEVVKIVTGFPPGGTSDTLCTPQPPRASKSQRR